MAKFNFFITGTDTDVGKTSLSVALLQGFNKRGLSTAALKPVASGVTDKSSDTLLLKKAITQDLASDAITPFAYELPIAPHIAASLQGDELSIANIMAACQPVLQCQTDVLLVEGCGGWAVPLNQQETMADLAKMFDFPVIIIIAMRLGCLNHALLTYQAIKDKHLHVAGWIANIIDPHVPYLSEQIASLNSLLAAPLLGVVPYQWPVDFAGMLSQLNLDRLLKNLI